jgi:hypothetical protein
VVDRAPTTYEDGRVEEHKEQVIPHCNDKQQQARRTQDLSRGSVTPQRSSYILVVEVTTKVGVSFTSLPPSKQPQRSLDIFTKKNEVIQTLRGSPRYYRNALQRRLKWVCGGGSPNRCNGTIAKVRATAATVFYPPAKMHLQLRFS